MLALRYSPPSSMLKHAMLGVRPYTLATRSLKSIYKYEGVKSAIDDSNRHTAALYLDNVYPVKWGRYDFIPSLFLYRNSTALLKDVNAYLPSQLPYDFHVTKVQQRVRDGGAIVNFTFKPDGERKSAESEAVDTILRDVRDRLDKKSSRAWFNFQRVRVFRVMGKPFSEDIINRYPTLKLKVDFVGPNLNEEKLFEEYRRYGTIYSITPLPVKDKNSNGSAIVQFTRLRAATSAQNCTHGHLVDSTILNVSFVKPSLPILLAAIVAFIYAIFDPVRVFFVTNKITGGFDIKKIPLIGNIGKDGITSLITDLYTSFISVSSHHKEEKHIGKERHEGRSRLDAMLNEVPDTFILLTGAKGSGKTAIILEATSKKKYKLFINTDPMNKARSFSEQLESLAKQVGYRPLLGFISTLTGAAELLIAATTGQKPDIASTPRSQIEKILECATEALRNLKEKQMEKLKYEAAKSGKRGDVEVIPPEDIPVVIISRFMDRPTPFASAIAEWAAELVENGLANVIVSTRNVSALRELQRALPQKTVNLLSINDASPEMAKSMVESQLTYSIEKTKSQRLKDIDLSSVIDKAVRILGGRLQDLQLFTQKVIGGQDPEDALEDVIQKSITEIRKHAFDNDSEGAVTEHAWTPEQFWYILTMLAESETVSYDKVRMSPLFKGDDKAIIGLEGAELISMLYNNDRPTMIRSGRPIYKSAFRRILDDVGFAGAMTIRVNNAYIKQETKKLEDAEAELSTLASLQPAFASEDTSASDDSKSQKSWWQWAFGLQWGKQPKDNSTKYLPGLPNELQSRALFLLKTIKGSQEKIEVYQAENSRISTTIEGL
ncbi:mitochondrial escape protein 2 [Mycoemilia scoparia]|uniref:Mitochondrial escape protein 2 n=1 Tax=Mycoemilia scoparia TaxID=417184 RepID=A0A9W8DUA0_9FUNG|nr:mitochondrial escape protein 2 [Mycoemilia scoparia]